ncbi:MAG: nascent polypeptide-associated complex protein [Candidatus Pacebacteria bacterium]|nr:nascent polypeptide-associated complex protein [Candidatus Paceibacterota bacterium]
MFGLGGGLDPKKMQAMMKQLGIKQEEIEAKRVVIEKEDGGKIIIEEPSVAKIVMQGQESWQISGKVKEEEEGIREEDVELVMGKTGKSKKEVMDALEEASGDIAEAIVKLS